MANELAMYPPISSPIMKIKQKQAASINPLRALSDCFSSSVWHASWPHSVCLFDSWRQPSDSCELDDNCIETDDDDDNGDEESDDDDDDDDDDDAADDDDAIITELDDPSDPYLVVDDI